MNRAMRLSVIMLCLLCMAGCAKEENPKDIGKSHEVKSTSKTAQSPTDAENVSISTDASDDRQIFYNKLVKENFFPGSELHIHEVLDLDDGKLVYAEWTGEKNSVEFLYACKEKAGEWKIKETARHLPAGPLGSSGMVLATGMCRGKMVVSILMEEVHANQDTEVLETWNPTHIRLFFADGSSQKVEIQTGERKMLLLDGKKKIDDWKLYAQEEEIYSYSQAENWNVNPVENLDFIEVRATPAPDDDRQLFYEQIIKENTDTNRSLRVHEVQDFANGKLVYAEWIGEGPKFEISYVAKNASGEWETKEASGHASVGSPGMAVSAGICQEKMIVSIAVEGEYWNPDTDTREIWNPDHIQLFFADGRSKDIEIQAGGRKLLVLETEREITDWKLYTEADKELYSYELAKKWGDRPVKLLDFVK